MQDNLHRVPGTVVVDNSWHRPQWINFPTVGGCLVDETLRILSNKHTTTTTKYKSVSCSTKTFMVSQSPSICCCKPRTQCCDGILPQFGLCFPRIAYSKKLGSLRNSPSEVSQQLGDFRATYKLQALATPHSERF